MKIDCKLQAHRGVSTDAPENTMSAFRLAKSLGYDTIELDPKFTRDGVCIILHDKTLNRTGRTNGAPIADHPINIRDTDLACLADIEVGSWFAPEFAGERIPTLEAVLKFALENRIELKLDNCIKDFTDAELEAFIEICKKIGDERLTGFTFDSLQLMKRFAVLFPSSPLHYDGEISEKNLDALREFKDCRDITVWMRYDNALTAWSKNPPITRAWAERIRRDFKLGLWILSDNTEFAAACEFSPDIIETTGAIKPKK